MHHADSAAADHLAEGPLVGRVAGWKAADLAHLEAAPQLGAPLGVIQQGQPHPVFGGQGKHGPPLLLQLRQLLDVGLGAAGAPQPHQVVGQMQHRRLALAEVDGLALVGPAQACEPLQHHRQPLGVGVVGQGVLLNRPGPGDALLRLGQLLADQGGRFRFIRRQGDQLAIGRGQVHAGPGQGHLEAAGQGGFVHPRWWRAAPGLAAVGAGIGKLPADAEHHPRAVPDVAEVADAQPQLGQGADARQLRLGNVAVPGQRQVQAQIRGQLGQQSPQAGHPVRPGRAHEGEVVAVVSVLLP